MIGIAAVVGAISIFAADFWVKSQAKAESEQKVASIVAPQEPKVEFNTIVVAQAALRSNILSPGMRAVTIRTDEIAGVGGFITPGDRVDVVLTRDAGAIQEVSKNAQGAAGSTVTSEIVVSDAKVLSVGQGADERKTEPQVANSVTLEVTNEGAQKVALARTVGTLSLSLRSAADASASGNGLTTISSFGGSVAASAEASAASLVNAVSK
ncbi:MAG: Flp pilus assembly protein CpaB, partial [Mesorhizobium sp.]